MMDGSFPVGSRDIMRDRTFRAIDAASGEDLATQFSVSSPEDVAEACRLASEAFDPFREIEPESRACFLESCADEVAALGDEVIETAGRETGLPHARLTGELARTTAQLRLFARVLREGHWADITIDPSLPERQPFPRHDLRRRNVALGPVAVFGASNFPLAFSVAGGDTASALAAGCPVVVKGHPAHPGTALLVARAMRRAVHRHSLPEGVFSLVQGPDHDLGAALVCDPRIKVVGFTGSRNGGLALIDIARGRPEPIPVYAEMSSINPVVLLPAALMARPKALAEGFAASLTMGAGQFCTNPGLILAVDGPDLDAFISATVEILLQVPDQVMLTTTIGDAYRKSIARASGTRGVTAHVSPAEREQGSPTLLSVAGDDFSKNAALAEEVFGPAAIVVRCGSVEQIADILERMEGQLTATMQIDAADYPDAARLLPILERKAGRILVNGWPTGVEVSHAMVHGGPFPATSNSRVTSVGAAAIARFLRPVSYQNVPDSLLPTALQAGNPLKLPRFVS